MFALIKIVAILGTFFGFGYGLLKLPSVLANMKRLKEQERIRALKEAQILEDSDRELNKRLLEACDNANIK